jgi:hypothetical protein
LLLYSSHLALGVFNWPVIYFINYTHHHRAINKFFWRRCRGTKKKKKLPRQLRAGKTSQVFLAPLPGRKKTSARGVSHAHPLLFLSFALLYFYLHNFIKNPKKLVSLIVVFTCLLLVLLK